eukprot:1425767-Alexandrium_andersonii.AAC.1
MLLRTAARGRRARQPHTDAPRERRLAPESGVAAGQPMPCCGRSCWGAGAQWAGLVCATVEKQREKGWAMELRRYRARRRLAAGGRDHSRR